MVPANALNPSMDCRDISILRLVCRAGERSSLRQEALLPTREDRLLAFFCFLCLNYFVAQSLLRARRRKCQSQQLAARESYRNLIFSLDAHKFFFARHDNVLFFDRYSDLFVPL